MTGLPLLSLLLAVPVAGVALIWCWTTPGHARFLALGTIAAEAALALVAVATFDAASPGFQFVERALWIPTLNVHYLLGVDGISVLFLPLSALLFLGVVVASWNTVQTLPRLYFSLLLLQLGATVGVFCALDTLLFFLFWELSLVPLYFLMSLWGVGPNRRFAAGKYTLLMLGTGVPLLFGFLLLAFAHAAATGAGVPAGLSFDFTVLAASPGSPGLQAAVFWLLIIGFAAKIPVFPLHTWLPMVAMEGPVAVGALLVGLKLGVYGLIRFAVPLAPGIAPELHWLLAGLGVIGILFGAVAALVQTNLRRMLAYAGVSHVGLVVLGLASFSTEGLQGAVLQTLNFTLAAGGLFLLTGFLHRRTGSTDVLSLGGAARTMPRLAALFLLFALASLGVPGTSGFPAELLLLVSALTTHAGAGLAALFGVVIGAAYMLDMYRRAFLGPVTAPAVAEAVDLLPRELAMALGLALVIFAVGFFPGFFLDLIAPAANAWIGRLG